MRIKIRKGIRIIIKTRIGIRDWEFGIRNSDRDGDRPETPIF